jgi:uncharacterized FlaG/YvyC family protein
MSTDFSIRPVGAPAPSPAIQPASTAANNAVQTELPASQSVTASDAAVTRNDAQVVSFDLSHEAYYDRNAGSMVYQIVDQKTAEVMDQFPDEAVLRRRAYFHALEMRRDNAPRALPTDLVA